MNTTEVCYIQTNDNSPNLTIHYNYAEICCNGYMSQLNHFIVFTYFIYLIIIYNFNLVDILILLHTLCYKLTCLEYINTYPFYIIKCFIYLQKTDTMETPVDVEDVKRH